MSYEQRPNFKKKLELVASTHHDGNKVMLDVGAQVVDGGPNVKPVHASRKVPSNM